MDPTQLLITPGAHVVIRGPDALLLRSSLGGYSFVHPGTSSFFDLSSKTYSIGIDQLHNHQSLIIETLFWKGEIIGFHLGCFLALFDDQISFKSWVKSCTNQLATPLKLIRKNPAEASWKIVLSVF